MKEPRLLLIASDITPDNHLLEPELILIVLSLARHCHHLLLGLLIYVSPIYVVWYVQSSVFVINPIRLGILWALVPAVSAPDSTGSPLCSSVACSAIASPPGLAWSSASWIPVLGQKR